MQQLYIQILLIQFCKLRIDKAYEFNNQLEHAQPIIYSSMHAKLTINIARTIKFCHDKYIDHFSKTSLSCNINEDPPYFIHRVGMLVRY